MNQPVRIITPKGGKQIWILHITKDDDIIGTIKFTDFESLIKFKNAYSSLPSESWGIVQLEFDTEKNNDNSF